MELKDELPFLKEKGFQRRQCINCKKFFWTLNSDQERCGDQPCVEYGFLGNPPTGSRPKLAEVRETFLSFFEKRHHKRIRRYPIVARWRDDVYLVGASIYDFQPWVTSGILPPPANPLVISQPSIRLTDVDNVGVTGRHLTSFEMMAHHAFNTPEKEVYWINQTTQYCYEFYTEAFGIRPELMSFKEDFWQGGGNGGEDLEVLISNAEAATLVFMHYAGEEGNWTPLPNRIVDTGYGLERVTWVLNGTPTIHDVTHPQMLQFLKSKAAIPKIDSKVLMESARLAGVIDLEDEDSVKHFQVELAKRTGRNWSELQGPISIYESAYTIADHTRSLAWMLGDFVVPSNVGVGYLARLVTRRILRHMHHIQLELPLTEVMKVQIEVLGEEFPEVVENQATLLEIVENEERKYRESLRKSIEIVERELKAHSKSRKGFSKAKLLELYDSHGLAPEIVQELASEKGVKVDVPLNFYSLVAEKHEKSKHSTKIEEKDQLSKLLEGLPETKPLYYDEPYRTEFEAQILKIVDSKYIVLDQTTFYPEGGGQPGDTGVLLSEKNKIRIKDTVKRNGIILHEFEASIEPPVEGWVHGEIDAPKRILLMRSHTATHILNGSSRSVLGPHVWQTGAQKGEQISRLDITHFMRLTRENVRKIEALANEIVMRNLPLTTTFMNREEAEAKYGYRLYQGGYVPGRKVRVVEIPGFDIEACGGTHLEHTGEIGVIKILRTERIQDGVERLEFSVGIPAVEYFEHLEEGLQEAGRLLETPMSNVPQVLEKTLNDLKAKQKILENLKLQLIESLAPKLLAKAEARDSMKLLVERLDGYTADDLIKIAASLTKDEASLVAVLYSVNERVTVIVSAGKKAVERGKDAGKIARALSQMVGGGGGGKPELGQGGGTETKKVHELRKYFEKGF